MLGQVYLKWWFRRGETLVLGLWGVKMVLPSKRNAHFRMLGHLGAILGHLGGILRHLGVILRHLGAILGHLGAILGHLGAILGPSRAILGPSWGHLRPSWDHLEPSRAVLGPSQGHVEPSCSQDSPEGASCCEKHVFCNEFQRFYDAIMGRLGTAKKVIPGNLPGPPVDTVDFFFLLLEPLHRTALGEKRNTLKTPFQVHVWMSYVFAIIARWRSLALARLGIATQH